MSDTIQIKIENARAVQNALDAFEKKVAKKVVRQGVRAAWKPLLNRTKENARSMVGGGMGSLIAKNTQLRAFKKQKRGQYGVLVRIKPGIPEFVHISASGKRAYIPAAIEYGHARPGRGGRGAAKDVAAIPFQRKALAVSLPNAPKIFAAHLERAIVEENAKK
jgi:hypothetical protein